MRGKVVVLGLAVALAGGAVAAPAIYGAFNEYYGTVRSLEEDPQGGLGLAVPVHQCLQRQAPLGRAGGRDHRFSDLHATCRASPPGAGRSIRERAPGHRCHRRVGARRRSGARHASRAARGADASLAPPCARGGCLIPRSGAP